MAAALAGAPPGASPQGGARIGPNAILQMVPALDAHTGPDIRRALLAEAGVIELPDGSGLIPEGPAAALHQALRRRLPHEAPRIAREAGLGTADYILAHRIPKPAQAVLKALPPALAAPVLAKAIARHAWTFAGSGRFAVASIRPLVFTLEDNPVVRGERSDRPLCAWHEAVFERLFRSLVSPRAAATETACCAQGAPACRFAIRLR